MDGRITKDMLLSTFRVGALVEIAGDYICVPCGYKKRLEKGDRFPKCVQCLGKEEGTFRQGFELWERSTKQRSQ